MRDNFLTGPLDGDGLGADALNVVNIESVQIDADANLDEKNNEGGTALHQSCFFCRPEIVQLLLENGPDFHVVNGRGLTATDVVSMEFGVELEGISRHVYE